MASKGYSLSSGVRLVQEMTRSTEPKHSLVVKRCRTFYRIRTERASVPDHFRHETRLPGDPVGDMHTGYALRRRELLMLALNDRALGGEPRIEKVRLALEGSVRFLALTTP